MVDRKRGLGRGLSALLPGTEPGLQLVPLSEIATNPMQPRQRFAEDSLQELADSIREHGVLQPLLVTPLVPSRPTGEHYQLVVGERRLRAARMAGLEKVPVLVRGLSSRESLEVALVENLQRQDLNPVEEAQAFQELMLAFGLTQEEVAGRVGRSRSAVANSLRLLKLPEPVLTMLQDGRLSEGQARPLLALASDDAIIRTAQQVVDGDLTARQCERLVRELLAPAFHHRPPQAPKPQPTQLEEQLRRRLGTKVNLVRTRRGGKLVIHFYSDEELDSIVRSIVGSDEGL